MSGKLLASAQGWITKAGLAKMVRNTDTGRGRGKAAKAIAKAVEKDMPILMTQHHDETVPSVPSVVRSLLWLRAVSIPIAERFQYMQNNPGDPDVSALVALYDLIFKISTPALAHWRHIDFSAMSPDTVAEYDHLLVESHVELVEYLGLEDAAVALAGVTSLVEARDLFT